MYTIEQIEQEIKWIFAKNRLTDADVHIGTSLLRKWKRLTNWVERTENPIKE